ncbi:alpha/beta hydrolase [Crossiella sp. CA-258035]|uniref:alpha/beta hydrolase n=1 Tax=Crossiella sp. CA-258035 TaxID=2981138 RepID=UPI0024BC5292|nr:alpha/beta hydrolase [Crossiella sp. CA-258035]WHT17804.1 alpha/beta hydrolase [Crossiella sp. CA-258035]
MTTVDELREAEPTVFTRAARRWQDLATSMTTRAEEVTDALRGLGEWRGAAAETAKQQLGGQRGRLDELAKGLGGIPPVLRDAGERLTRLQESLRAALATAHANRLRVSSDGQVTDDAVVVAIPPQPGRPNRAQLCAELTTTLRDTLRQAATVDAEAAAALRRLTQEATGIAPGGIQVCTSLSATIPAAGTSPAEVKRWWDGLSIADRESLLASDGARIGALDGIPAVVRDRANRVVLAGLRASLAEERTRLEAKAHRTPDDEKRLVDLRSKLTGLDAIAARLATPPSKERPPPFLLRVSADGKGRAVVAMGDPDRAANVATLVPGTFASLAGGANYLNHADAMAHAAARAGSPSTSVISWVGYDAPQSLVPEAAQDSFADNARADLARFQDGLRVTHEGEPSHNTVVGHSYGSTVVGHTARDLGIKADDVVFIGSPGVGVERADQLNLPPDRVHASVAQHDIIKVTNMPMGVGGAPPGVPDPMVPGPVSPGGGLNIDPHGPDPATPGFGGKVFTSDPGTPGLGDAGGLSEAAHNEYWEDRNRSLRNMGRVIAGQPTD